MCTLCLSDMGELRDDWLREPRKAATPTDVPLALAVAPAPGLAVGLGATAVVHALPDGMAA